MKMPGPWRRRLIRGLVYCTSGYVVVLIVLSLLENRLLYFPTRAAADWTDPKELLAEDISLQAPDGTPIHAWWCPKSSGDGAILYAHGNGGNLSHRARIYADLQREQNLSVLAFDYPGYGKSGGKPCEAGCYAAADAAYEWLTKTEGMSPERVVLFGESLGGGVVVDLASRRPCRALVLFSTFSSVPEVAKSKFPFFPVQTLMSNRFDSLHKIQDIHRPVFMSHGDADDLIPLKFAQRLFDAAPGPKQMLIDPGRGHHLSLRPEFHTALREFLKQNAPLK
jgi:fermentation-respiration switch protein FrsA (DUF1100 family)